MNAAWLETEKLKDVETGDLLVCSYCAETQSCRLINCTHMVAGQHFGHFSSSLEDHRVKQAAAAKKGGV